jgi:hypothetical protein
MYNSDSDDDVFDDLPPHLYDIARFHEEQIYETDYNEDGVSGHRYLGTVSQPDDKGELLVDTRINSQLFFAFDKTTIIEYLSLPYHPEHRLYGNLELIQLVIQGDTYTAIIKTFWIRMIQRAWKKRFEEYMKRIKNIVMGVAPRVGPLPRISRRGMLLKVLFVECE